MSKRLWYLASPYTRYPDGIYTAYVMACCEAALLLKSGIVTFAPIPHSHGIAIHGDISPLDHEIWLAADRLMMDRCDGLIMLMADSWRDSYGMAVELEAFARAGKPVVWMTPGTVPAELQPKR